MCDLVRLGIFGRNPIDTHKVKKKLFLSTSNWNGIDVLYTLQKTEDVLLVIELDSIVFPTTVKDIPGIFGYLDRIADIVHIFKNYVNNKNTDTQHGTSRKTMPSPLVTFLSL